MYCFECQPRASAVPGTGDAKVSKTGETSAAMEGAVPVVRGVNGQVIHKQMSGPWAMMSVLKTGKQERPAGGYFKLGTGLDLSVEVTFK